MRKGDRSICGRSSYRHSKCTCHCLRACLKRGDSRGIEAVHLDYEKEPTVSHRSDRPSVELYQRIDPAGKAGRTTAQPGDASGHQCDLVHCREWLSMAHVASGVASVAKRVHLLPTVAR